MSQKFEPTPMLEQSRKMARSELADFCKRAGIKPQDLFGGEISVTVDNVANENPSQEGIKFAMRKAALVALAENNGFDLAKVDKALRKIKGMDKQEMRRLRQEVYKQVDEARANFISALNNLTDRTAQESVRFAVTTLGVFRSIGLKLSTEEQKEVLASIRSVPEERHHLWNVGLAVLEKGLALLGQRDPMAANNFLERLGKYNPELAISNLFVLYNESNKPSMTSAQFENATEIAAKTRSYNIAKKYLFMRPDKQEDAQEIAMAALRMYCFDYGFKFDSKTETEILRKVASEQGSQRTKLSIESTVFKYVFIAALQNGESEKANEAICKFGERNQNIAIDIVADATLATFGENVKTSDPQKWQKTISQAKAIASTKGIFAGLAHFGNNIVEAWSMLSSLEDVERRRRAA